MEKKTQLGGPRGSATDGVSGYKASRAAMRAWCPAVLVTSSAPPVSGTPGEVPTGQVGSRERGCEEVSLAKVPVS